MKILLTGGAGFIGSAVVRHIIENTVDDVVIIDKLTYAGNLNSLQSVIENPRCVFEKADICNENHMTSLFKTHQPDVIMHLAAESHVDRSINGPSDFITTNILGTYTLLEVSKNYFQNLSDTKKCIFRFHHVSTDEVYGDLADTSSLFTETTPYEPSSPYSASKASSDHLVRAWSRTFGLPVIVTNCSNNYGPYHFPEKLIPLTILNAIAGSPLAVYGSGEQIRDWLYVEDHAEALYLVLMQGNCGETYNIGGHNEQRNIDVVHRICELLQNKLPNHNKLVKNYKDLIRFVKDRPGHDQRYAIDAGKIERELGWRPKETFESGLEKTVDWYINNTEWWQAVLDGSYRNYPHKK